MHFHGSFRFCSPEVEQPPIRVSAQPLGCFTNAGLSWQGLQSPGSWRASRSIIYRFRKGFRQDWSCQNFEKKLWNIGVRGKLWLLLKSYLSGRKQAVRVVECISAIIAVTSGFHQGSLLGPLLFLILINDIPEVCESNEILLCADDAKMLKSSSQALFQLDVDSLVEWCSDNSMVLNATKCCVLSIGRHGSPDITMILGASVQWTVKQKDLGIIVDEKLSWDAHISEKLSKALKTFYLIRRNCCVRSPQAKTAMYKSMIIPVLAFGSQAWHPNFSIIRKLNAFQNRVIRWILEHDCSHDLGLTTTNLLPIPLYLQLCDLLMLSKIVQGNYEVLDELILVVSTQQLDSTLDKLGARGSLSLMPDSRALSEIIFTKDMEDMSDPKFMWLLLVNLYGTYVPMWLCHMNSLL